jgi:tetratricopeptide (TPR) repeat protein
VQVSGTVSIDTPEGARLAVPYRLEVQLEPAALTALAAGARDGSPQERWRSAAEDAIRAAAAGTGLAVVRAGPGRDAALSALRARPPLSGSSIIDLRIGAAAASDRRGRPLAAPVVLIGLDGADWLVIEPLLASGKLPNLERLVRSGSRASLRSAPPLLSPLLWTSIATGVPPDRHGVVDFTVYDPVTKDRAPISSRARRAPALWNILTAYGLSSVWLGWWATWPAEPVAGMLVSDRVAYSLFAAGGEEGLDGKVYPPEIWPEARARRTLASQVPWQELRRFAALSPSDLAGLEKRSPPRSGEEFRDRLDHLRQVVASTRTYAEQARWARQRLRPDLLAVYFQGIDEVSHRFMHYAPPARMKVPPAEARRFGGTVEAFYREQDRLLGPLVTARPGETPPVVMVVSDHGFLSGAARPPRPADEFEGGAADWHRLHGIFVLSGPGVHQADLGTVSLYDVFPTLLYLCGLPVPEGLPGRPLVEAFAPPFRAANPVEELAAFDVPFGPEGGASANLPESERAEVLARLRALGYIGDAGASAGAQGRSHVPDGAGSGPAAAAGAGAPPAPAGPPDLQNEFLTAHMNLGTLYGERRDWERATAEYRSVVEHFPNYAPALYKWMESEFKRGQAQEAWKAAERLLALSPRPVEWLPSIAEVAAAAGRSDALRADLERQAGGGRASAPVLSALGLLALKAGRRAEAADLLHRALETDPLRPEALDALYSLDSSPAARARLLPILRRALEQAPRSVFHLNYMAGLLVASGRCAEAKPYLATALEQNPDSAPARTNLARCLTAEGKVEPAVVLLERGLSGSPDELTLLTTLGALEAGRGNLEKAVSLLERARTLSPDDTGILNALGLARLQSGQPGQARDLLRHSLEANPDQPDVRSLLASIPGS